MQGQLFDLPPVPILKKGDKVTVTYRLIPKITDKPEILDVYSAKPGRGRLKGFIKAQFSEPVEAIFLGWSFIQLGNYDPGGDLGYEDEAGYDEPSIIPTEQRKVAWLILATGERYLKPFRVLEEDCLC